MTRQALALLLVFSLIACLPSGRAPVEPSRGAILSPLPSDFVVEDRREYTSFQEALRNGQLDIAERRGAELPADRQALVTGLEQVLEGRNEEALPTFQSLMTESEDRNLAGLSAMIVARLLHDSGQHRALAAMLGSQQDVGSRLIRLLATLPPQQVEPGGSDLSLLEVGPRGHPSIEVLANGHEDLWYFDTGAALSVVSSSVAAEFGLRSVSAEPLAVSTATSLAPEARLGLLQELTLGGVSARDVPVLIYPDADLTFNLEEGTAVRIRGIVGWPIIRELHAELDYAAGRYRAELSTAREPPMRNFSWLGYPLVSLASDGGQPLIFGLDTGSWNSSITENIFDKVDLGPVRDELRRIGGVGGYQEVEVRVVDELALALGGSRVLLGETHSEQGSGGDDIVFFAADGVLGSDIAQQGRLVLDYKNGYLGLEPAR